MHCLVTIRVKRDQGFYLFWPAHARGQRMINKTSLRPRPASELNAHAPNYPEEVGSGFVASFCAGSCRRLAVRVVGPAGRWLSQKCRSVQKAGEQYEAEGGEPGSRCSFSQSWIYKNDCLPTPMLPVLQKSQQAIILAMKRLAPSRTGSRSRLRTAWKLSTHVAVGCCLFIVLILSSDLEFRNHGCLLFGRSQ